MSLQFLLSQRILIEQQGKLVLVLQPGKMVDYLQVFTTSSSPQIPCSQSHDQSCSRADLYSGQESRQAVCRSSPLSSSLQTQYSSLSPSSVADTWYGLLYRPISRRSHRSFCIHYPNTLCYLITQHHQVVSQSRKVSFITSLSFLSSIFNPPVSFTAMYRTPLVCVYYLSSDFATLPRRLSRFFQKTLFSSLLWAPQPPPSCPSPFFSVSPQNLEILFPGTHKWPHGVGSQKNFFQECNELY